MMSEEDFAADAERDQSAAAAAEGDPGEAVTAPGNVQSSDEKTEGEPGIGYAQRPHDSEEPHNGQNALVQHQEQAPGAQPGTSMPQYTQQTPQYTQSAPMYPPPPQVHVYQQAAPYGPPRANGIAVASLVLSLTGLFSSGIPLFVGLFIGQPQNILAIIFGIVGINRAKTRGVGTGPAVAGLIIGSLSFLGMFFGYGIVW